MLITFFPHATSLDNEAGISTGTADVALSVLGKGQVTNLKSAAAHENFDAVFCSDLVRARATAEGAFGDRFPIAADARLREIDIGIMTGEKDSSTAPLIKNYIENPFPGGESFKDVEKRMRDFLTDVSREFLGKKIAIVGHQGTQLALEVITKKISWQEAIKKDWRNGGAFQYGWNYIFTPEG